MAERKPDFLLKRIWLINGFLVLALFAFGACAFIWSGVNDLLDNHQHTVATKPANNATVSPRAVRFSAPVKIAGSNALMVRVSYGEDYYEDDYYTLAKSSGVGSVYDRNRGLAVNVIFLQPDGSGHLLFTKPVSIGNIDYPTETDKVANQQWITYEAWTMDTNGNGQLDANDRKELYITDNKGFGLKRLLDDGYTLQSVSAIDGGKRLIINAYQLAPNQTVPTSKLRQVAFTYDFATKQLKQYDLLNGLTEKAARMLGK